MMHATYSQPKEQQQRWVNYFIMFLLFFAYCVVLVAVEWHSQAVTVATEHAGMVGSPMKSSSTCPGAGWEAGLFTA